MIPEIVAQHAEEASFLWLLRDEAASAPHYELADLARLDGRVEAHLDGLRVAGADGWDMSQRELEWEAPGEVFAAGVLAIESGEREHFATVLTHAAAPEMERALASALGWTPSPHAFSLVNELLNDPAPARRRIGVAASAIRREDLGASWTRWFVDDDSGVRVRTLKAAAELGKYAYLSDLQRSTFDKDPACCFWAAWSGARLGDRSPAAVQALRDVATQPGPFQERAVAMAVRTMDLHGVRDWLRPFWKEEKTLRLAAAGIAASGNPEFVPVLLQIMQVNEAARPAGEAFAMITGAHVSYDKLERDPPADFEAGPTEDPADENVAMDPDEDLPWPDPKLVETWWQANSARFADGRRYLCGREITPAALVQTLRDGYQRQRTAAAIELALLEPNRPMFEVRARGDWQQQLLPVWFPGV